VRYADDCNIYVRSVRAGERVMSRVSRFLDKKLKLKVNRGKSAVARPGERKFLGFSFTSGSEPRRRIAPRALERFKLRVRELTRTGRHLAPSQLVHRLKLFLTGWRGYFGFCETPSVLGKLDSWLRRRLRMVFWRQWKRGWSRFAALRRLGVGRDLAAKTAGSALGPWRLSRSPALSFALPNTYFISLGLPTLALGR
jgi:RNA-directed DNA polymerase